MPSLLDSTNFRVPICVSHCARRQRNTTKSWPLTDWRDLQLSQRTLASLWVRIQIPKSYPWNSHRADQNGSWEAALLEISPFGCTAGLGWNDSNYIFKSEINSKEHLALKTTNLRKIWTILDYFKTLKHHESIWYYYAVSKKESNVYYESKQTCEKLEIPTWTTIIHHHSSHGNPG